MRMYYLRDNCQKYYTDSKQTMAAILLGHNFTISEAKTRQSYHEKKSIVISETTVGVLYRLQSQH